MELPVQDIPVQQAPAKWSLAALVGFRFCIIYFLLFCALTQIITSFFPVPNIDVPDPSSLWPFRQITFWIAAHVFRVRHDLVYTGSGSGDKTFDWILAAWLLAFSALAAVAWSILDRRRESYSATLKWFRLFLRFALVSQMFVYGVSKVIPLQMPFPRLTKLVEPFGNFSPMGVLWASIGASTAYEIFTGSIEVLAGILLVIPQTAMAGVLLCLAASTQVFILNMTYDVPVKLFSFHLILMSLFLLVPEFSRLGNFLLWNRPVPAAVRPPLFRSSRANRIAFVSQILLGAFLLGMNGYVARDYWRVYGGGRPEPPLYGIWTVQQQTTDGVIRSPLIGDYGSWRRFISDFPTVIVVQHMDDSFVPYGATLNSTDKILTLTSGNDPNWKAVFHVARPALGQLTLDGTMDGHKVSMQLQLVDRNKFLLVNRGFHWIQEYPFNR
jgi:hypothetical protein